jgi:hypothetical protein
MCASGVQLAQLRKAIGAPVLASDSVMYEEKTLRVILCLHSAQPRVIPTPVRLLPFGVEVIAFGQVGARVRSDAAQLCRCRVDATGVPVRGIDIDRSARQARVGRALATSDDHERKGRQGRGIHRRFCCGRDRLRRCTRQSFVEVHLEVLPPARRKQRVHKSVPGVRLQ